MEFVFFHDSTAEKSSRISDGESVIDLHAVVIARRSLLIFFYKQLHKLFKGDFFLLVVILITFYEIFLQFL